MATMTLTLDKLVNNDFNSGDTIEPNKWAQWSTFSAVMVFKGITDDRIRVYSATPKIGSIKVGGGNVLTEEAKFDFEFGVYNGSTFMAQPGWTGSFTVKEGSVSNKTCAIDKDAYFGATKGAQFAYRLTVSSNNTSRVAKTTLSNFGLSIEYEVCPLYTITLDANGGEFFDGSSVISYTRYKYQVLDFTSKGEPIRLGYDFRCWSTARDDPNDTYKQWYYNETKGDTTLYAQYDIESYTVTTVASPPEGGTTTGDGVYEYGSVARMTATPNEGYIFVCWYADYSEQPLSYQQTFSMIISSDETFTAVFKKADIYTITTEASPPEGGVTTGGGVYYEGTRFVISATPNKGYKFVTWYYKDGGAGIHISEQTRELIADANRNYTAYFELDKIQNVYRAKTKQDVYRANKNIQVYRGKTKIYG